MINEKSECERFRQVKNGLQSEYAEGLAMSLIRDPKTENIYKN